MKISDILNSHADYYISSFHYPDDPEGRAERGEDQEDARSKVFLPSHVQLDGGEPVEIVHDGEVIMVDTWDAIQQWLKDNWDSLSGTYYLAQSGRVIHHIRTTNVDSN